MRVSVCVSLSTQDNARTGEATTFFFMSEDALTNPNRLLVLIHGSGAVRAGQWARRCVCVCVSVCESV